METVAAAGDLAVADGEAQSGEAQLPTDAAAAAHRPARRAEVAHRGRRLQRGLHRGDSHLAGRGATREDPRVSASGITSETTIFSP